MEDASENTTIETTAAKTVVALPKDPMVVSPATRPRHCFAVPPGSSTTTSTPSSTAFSLPPPPPPLSELSKQLRALQATNQSQSVEIDRLERQLKILADLQGISVDQLRSALEDACKSEAFDEWKSRVNSLRSQLEAATAVAVVSDDAPKQQEVAAMTASHRHQVANLELRIGELEEIESRQRNEIESLYQQLKDETAKSTRLQLENQNQREELISLKDSLPSTAIVPFEQSNNSNNGNATPTPWAEEARKAQMELQVQQNQLALTEQHHQSVEQQLKLKNSQLQAREVVQDERIQDLEQQLSSLYVAFGLLREERTAEQENVRTLKNHLEDAGFTLAQQVNSESGRAKRTPSSSSSAVVVKGETPQGKISSSSPKQQRPLSSSRQQQNRHYSEEEFTTIIHTGELLLRTNNRLRKWKKQTATLSLDDVSSEFQLQIGGGAGAGKPYALKNVKMDRNSTPHPYSFGLHIDDGNNNATVLHLAATNGTDYEHWLSSMLIVATTGETSNNNNNNEKPSCAQE